MFKKICKATVWILSVLFATALGAQQLPKSGSFDTQTGWKATGDAFEVADKRMLGGGSVMGMIFNLKGSGPLHAGPATCFYTFSVVEGSVKNKGYCAFGDADGDLIFTYFHGANATEGTEGINNIVGGTGKYTGIQGSGTWKSKDVGTKGHHYTRQHFEYRLP